MNLYLKVFFWIALPFGIILGIIVGVLAEIFNLPAFVINVALLIVIFSGVFYGGFVSLIVVSIHRWSVKRISSDTSQEAMGVRHVRNFELQLPFDEAFDLCLESLGVIKKCKCQNENRAKGNIEAKAGLTWKTFGDQISIVVCEIGDDSVEVEVSSKPAIRMTLVDYGKNLENLNKIGGFLTSQHESTVKSPTPAQL